MSSPAELLRSHLTSAENVVVTDADVDSALTRCCAGLAPRTRVEAAALMVYAGPASTRVPPLESFRLRRPLLARLWAARSQPLAAAASLVAEPFEPCRAETRVPQAA